MPAEMTPERVEALEALYDRALALAATAPPELNTAVAAVALTERLSGLRIQFRPGTTRPQRVRMAFEIAQGIRQISDQAAAERVITAYLRGECPEGDVKVMLDRLPEEAWNRATADQIERDRWKLKAEQYQTQLDSRWEGVVAQVNTVIDENTRLRAQVARLQGLVRAVHEGCDGMTWATDPPSQCPTCALLSEPAPEGQRCVETVCHEGHVCDQGPPKGSRLVPEAEWRALGADVIAERDALRAYILQSGGDDSLLAWIATHGAEEAAKIRRVAEAARDHVRGCSVLHHELKDSVLAWKPQDREAVAAVEQAQKQKLGA